MLRPLFPDIDRRLFLGGASALAAMTLGGWTHGAPPADNLLDGFVNVVDDFGADPTGLTPSGTAIQAAFDASTVPNPNFPATANKPIFFPPGTYDIDQQLFLKNVSGAYLLGCGKHQTILKYSGPASNRPGASFNGQIYGTPDLLNCDTAPSPPLSVGDTISGTGIPGGTTLVAGGPFIWVLNTHGVVVTDPGVPNITASSGAFFEGGIGPAKNPVTGTACDVLETTSAISVDFISFNQIISGGTLPANTTILDWFHGSAPAFWLISSSGVSSGSSIPLTTSAGFTSLFTAEFCGSGIIRGMTFDVTGSNATIAYSVYGYDGFPGDGGTNFLYEDVGFVGATDDGYLCGLDQNSLGSERYFLGCSFLNCARALIVSSSNALNYTFVACDFQNCPTGAYAPTGSLSAFIGCYFNSPGYATFTGAIGPIGPNNMTVTPGSVTGTITKDQIVTASNGTISPGTLINSGSGNTWTVSFFGGGIPQSLVSGSIDILVRQSNAISIIGCWSESPFFFQGSPVDAIACYHNPPNPGGVWSGGIDVQVALINGSVMGTNSTIWGSEKPYLFANSFSNTGYITTNFVGTVGQDI